MSSSSTLGLPPRPLPPPPSRAGCARASGTCQRRHSSTSSVRSCGSRSCFYLATLPACALTWLARHPATRRVLSHSTDQHAPRRRHGPFRACLAADGPLCSTTQSSAHTATQQAGPASISLSAPEGRGCRCTITALCGMRFCGGGSFGRSNRRRWRSSRRQRNTLSTRRGIAHGTPAHAMGRPMA